MVNTVPDILARIVEHKKVELQDQKVALKELETRAEALIPEKRDFKRALEVDPPSIIAEIKKASPSKGLLSASFDPPAIASEYESGGAAALSILTDERFFQGSLEDLKRARSAVGLPVLRKDFTIDPYHVVEAAANGADAILLIAAILTVTEMRKLRELASSYRMASLVEVHDGEELDRALNSGAEIIGVNNRNLHTFAVTLETSKLLADRIPRGIVKVTESGIESREQVLELSAAGFKAFLVGEHLMRSSDPASAVRALIQ